MHFLEKIIDKVPTDSTLYIQTHNYPDMDAVTSAFALQYLLSELGQQSSLIYDGEIQRDSLSKTINDFKIDIKKYSAYKDISFSDKSILIDGNKGNLNMTDVVTDEIAVIDHHQSVANDDVLFSDIRSKYGSCATIIHAYYKDLNITIPSNIATALVLGISSDTGHFTRGVNEKDIEAYYDLYNKSDIKYINSILRNNIVLDDLKYFRYIIDHLSIDKKVGFCHFADGCDQNLLGILNDFVLSLNEVNFSVLTAKNGLSINISVRNEMKNVSGCSIIKKLLKNRGAGGGHVEMAGGIIFNEADFDEKVFLSEIIEKL